MSVIRHTIIANVQQIKGYVTGRAGIKTMKILLVNYEYKPQCGGAGLGTYNMAKAFQKMGHDVSLLIGWDYTYGKPVAPNGICMHIVRIKKKNIHQSTAFGMVSFLVKGLPLIHCLTKKNSYDIIQFYFSVPTGVLKYGIANNIPYVVSLRGMDIPGFRNDKYKYLSKLSNHINYKITKKAAAVTSLSSEATKKYKEFAPDIKIQIIPNAVEYEIYQVKDHYTNTPRRFVAVSRLTGFKKLDILIKAFSYAHKKYCDIILDIYGDGIEYNYLKCLIQELQADNYISLKGYAPRDQLISILPSYDVFSLVSVGDSFGMVFIEAMAVGLPVLCTNAGGPVDIIENHKNGIFVKNSDIEDTEKGIIYCIEHPAELEQCGRKGRRDVENRFSINGVAERHIKLYDAIKNNT